jgi:hypothetical protein
MYLKLTLYQIKQSGFTAMRMAINERAHVSRARYNPNKGCLSCGPLLAHSMKVSSCYEEISMIL